MKTITDTHGRVEFRNSVGSGAQVISFRIFCRYIELGCTILGRSSDIKSLRLGNNTVKYVEAGKGQPMLFLHNGGSGHWVWHYQIQHFAKNYRVLAFDMLGCGASDRPDVTYDLGFYSTMARNILEQLDLKDVILVGNCVGAAAALECASRDSSRLKALVLFNVCGGHQMMSPMVRLASLPLSHRATHQAALNVFRRTPKLVTAAVRTNFATPQDSSHPVYAAEIKEAFNPLQTASRINLTKGLASFNKFSQNFDRAEWLPPVAVFWGKENKVLPLAKGLQFCDRLKPDQQHIISNAGHLVMAEKPSTVNTRIEAFLSGLNAQTVCA